MAYSRLKKKITFKKLHESRRRRSIGLQKKNRNMFPAWIYETAWWSWNAKVVGSLDHPATDRPRSLNHIGPQMIRFVFTYWKRELKFKKKNVFLQNVCTWDRHTWHVIYLIRGHLPQINIMHDASAPFRK